MFYNFVSLSHSCVCVCVFTHKQNVGCDHHVTHGKRKINACVSLENDDSVYYSRYFTFLYLVFFFFFFFLLLHKLLVFCTRLFTHHRRGGLSCDCYALSLPLVVSYSCIYSVTMQLFAIKLTSLCWFYHFFIAEKKIMQNRSRVTTAIVRIHCSLLGLFFFLL